MESNSNNPDFSRVEVPLDEPHFDEEATLMAARPVVPLHEVKSEQRSNRRLIFGALLVAAVMVGVFGATLVYMQRADNRSAAVVETALPVSEPDPPAESRVNQAGGASTHSDAAQAAEESREAAPLVGEQADDQVGRHESENDDPPIVPDRQLERPAEYAGTNQTNEDDDDDQEKEIRRAERKEERRLKRLEREARDAAKRETRAAKGRSDNDLLRIREIFEGSPRP